METKIEQPTRPSPSLFTRRLFLSGRLPASAAQLTPRQPRKRAEYVQKPERIPTKGDKEPKQRKKLTGSIPLKVRKQMLAVKLRKAGVRTVAGYFAKKAG